MPESARLRFLSPVCVLLRGLLLAVLAIALAGCEKYALDRQMMELCKKDGGVRVYETVTLPPEMFDQWGDPFNGWRERPLERKINENYEYVRTITFISDGDPFSILGGGKLSRNQIQVTRSSDEKVLGESIYYVRVGGDFIPYAHPSGKICPLNQPELLRSIFIQEKLDATD